MSAGIAQMERRSDDFTQVIDDRCLLMNRLQIVNALDGQVIIRNEDDSRVILQGYHIGTLGDCCTSALVEMSKSADWKVPPIDEGRAKGRFMRDLEVSVGEPFGMLFYYPDSRRHFWINFGRIATIAVCPPEVPELSEGESALDFRD